MTSLRPLAVGCALACAALAAPTAGAAGIGPFAAWNAVIFDDFVGNNSDVEGGLAVGDDVTITGGFGINSKNTSGDGTYVFVTGDALTWTSSGQVYRTDRRTAIGGSRTTSGSVNFQGGVDNPPATPPVDFAALRTLASAMSQDANALATTGTSVRHGWGGVEFFGTGAAIEVFDIAAADFNNANTFLMSGISSTANVIINVLGTDVVIRNVESSVPFGGSRSTLLNLPSASRLFIENTSPHASILAPSANIVGQNGHIEGTVIARNFGGSTFANGTSLELHFDPYTG
nr:choice-of-anchor A family protein [Burkholderiales bacterium]